MCYISYPRVTYRDDPWVTVTQINPRGRVDGTSDDDEPLQPESTSNAQAVEDLANVELVEDLTEFGLDAVVHSEPEAEVGESAPPAAAQQDPGVMPVDLLVQQPGREHLPVLHPNPRRGHSTWLVFLFCL